jgi:hypothetical protein
MPVQKRTEKHAKTVRIVGGASELERAALLFTVPQARTIPTLGGLALSTVPVETFDVQLVGEIDASVTMVLDDLITALSPVSEVLAIIAEPIEDHHAIHITVFATPLTDSVRDTIYSAELSVIDKFQSMAFDFHVREPERVDGSVVIPPAPYALVLWHRPGANAEHQ